MATNAAPVGDRRPVVYLIAQPTVSRNKKPLDLSKLYEHGEVQVLCPTGDSPSFTPVRCMDAMESRFAPYDPEVDFLVWAGGDTLAAVMAGMLLAEREVYEFRWLRWERDREEGSGRRLETGKYIPVTIDLAEPDYEDEDDMRDMTGDLLQDRV